MGSSRSPGTSAYRSTCARTGRKHCGRAVSTPLGRRPGSPKGYCPTYLPAEAQDLLFDRLHELSAPGSRVAVEGFGPEYFSEAKQRIREERMDAVRAEAARSGKPIFDVSDLFYIEPREDIAEWLTRHGWQTRFETSAEVTARYKPEVAGEVPDVGSEFVDAKLS